MHTLLLYLCFGGSLRDLGHDDFVVREVAQTRLENYSVLTWRMCNHHHPNNLEASRRCQRVVKHHLAFTLALPPLTMALGGGSVEWDGGPAGESPLGARRTTSGSTSPGPGWTVGWVRPRSCYIWASLVRYYLQASVCTSHDWPNWHTGGEAQWATRMLATDLCRAGVPRYLVKSLLCSTRQ